MADNKFVTRTIERIVKGLYPNKCLACNKALESHLFVCKECEKQIVKISEPYCERCGKLLADQNKTICNDCRTRKRYFDKGIALFEYSGTIRESIHKFKYNNVRAYGEYYGQVAKNMYLETLDRWKIAAIVPVPIYRKKKIKRGYNQAQVFGEALSKEVNIPVDNHLLIRVKNTVPQKGLDNNMRYINLKEAFAVNMDKAKSYNTVLLVDDIFTTGSTVDMCSMALKTAGVDKVYVLCIATGYDHD